MSDIRLLYKTARVKSNVGGFEAGEIVSITFAFEDECGYTYECSRGNRKHLINQQLLEAFVL